jgi:hypothetical protein
VAHQCLEAALDPVQAVMDVRLPGPVPEPLVDQVVSPARPRIEEPPGRPAQQATQDGAQTRGDAG